MEPILDIAIGSFVAPGAHRFRLLGAVETRALLERVDVEKLRTAGIYYDPFDAQPDRSRRRRYKVAEVEELPENFDPFSVTELVEPEAEEMIAWDKHDRQQAEASFAREPSVLDEGLSASDKWLAVRSPFRVTLWKERV